MTFVIVPGVNASCILTSRVMAPGVKHGSLGPLKSRVDENGRVTEHGRGTKAAGPTPGTES